MKKTISMILASALAISAAVPVLAEDSFKDLSETGDYSWSYQYVEDMAKKGFISGYEDGTFRAGNSVSRLEAFALFARLMGSNNAVNEGVVSAAKAKYKDVLAQYELSYAEGDVAFMLYRGVLKEEELDTYFKDDKKKEAMPRYEAAILITKAMLGEAEATAEVLTDLEYSDVKDMPDDSKQYVYYVTKKEIMSGMGDGGFSPNTAVLRGQVAVMMSKTINAVNYEFKEAEVVTADFENNTIKIKDAEDVLYDADTKFFYQGEASTEEAIKEGQNIVLTFVKDGDGKKLAYADIVEKEEDATLNGTVEGIYRGYKGSGEKILLIIEDAMTGVSSEYECSDEVADNIELTNDDYARLTIENGVVVLITSMSQVSSIKDAVIKEINPMGIIKISHESESYNDKSYTLSNNAKIFKNGESIDFWGLYDGIVVDISLEYGLATKLEAKAEISTAEGTLSKYTVSDSPTMTLNENGTKTVYQISNKAEITYNGKKAKLTDLEIDAVVTVTVENNLVIGISATAPEEQPAVDSLTGVVKAVSPLTKVIMISYNNENSEVIEYIICGEETNLYVVPTLSEYSLDKINVGDTIVAYGEYLADRFMCTGVTVSPAK